MKTTRKRIALAGACSLAFCLSALAQDEGGKPKRPPRGDGAGRQAPSPEEIMKRLDKNSDGSIDLDEFKKSRFGQRDAEAAAERFKKMDKDDDGKLSKPEFEEGFKKMRERMRNGGGERPGPKRERKGGAEDRGSDS